MNTTIDGPALHRAVSDLRAALDTSGLPLETAHVDDSRAELAQLVAQLDDYVLPRLESLDAPLLAVIGGSTGAGKSTLVNSVVGHEVTRPGVLRPTTRASVLIHHPQDAGWFTTDRVLPGLRRLTGAGTDSDDPSSLRLVTCEAVPAGLALLDAPDIDSVVEANRDLARQLLAAADLWLFVTTAARYADAVPWSLLNQASERGTSVAIVLDRVSPEAVAPIREDLVRMLAEQGLGSAPVFTVPETTLVDGLVPPGETAAIRKWLNSLADDAAARQDVIRRTLDGALASLRRRGTDCVHAAEEQVSAREALHTASADAYAQHLDAVREGLADGTLLRGEVLARWQEFVGTGEMFKQFDAGVSKVRDRLSGMFKARVETAAPAKDLGQALQSGIAALVTSHLESAALEVGRAWRADPAGKALLAVWPDTVTASPQSVAAVEELVRQWQGDVLDLVREEAAGKRKTARFLALGVNGVAVLLMVITFASTAGLTGAEIGIAGGSAVVGQRLLEAVFGDQAVRTLSSRARTMLMERIGALFAHDERRFDELVESAGVDVDAPAQITRALDAVEAAR